ncbi:MAG: hypothetical protein OXN97_21460 [Bryobacterales bacterium]|nr:hypothetical protein [Bryobacterales bacterium]MDE0625421.1 hypothetical protein [Bryobacterales bacterium]
MRRAVRPEQGRGSWPVARQGLGRGLQAWSDLTFRVFPHVCLLAEWAGGRLELGRGGSAREPGKSRATPRCRLHERAGEET